MIKSDLLKNSIITTIFTIVLIIIDQVTKVWARTILATSGSINIIPNFFDLTYVENRGAAFGFFQGKAVLFIVITFLAIAVFVHYLSKQINTNENARYLFPIISLVIAGAIGNLIDRISFGFVTDMLDFKAIWSFVFNVADIYVVIGMISLMGYILIFDNKN